MATGADLFPKEARANRGVFYDGNGNARSLGQIYEFFDKKFSNDTAPATMAHKPNEYAGRISGDKAGYQHIPFSLKQPIEIINAPMTGRQASAFNSLYQLENSLEAFFKQPANTGFGSGFGEAGFYGSLKSPTSVLLDILK